MQTVLGNFCVRIKCVTPGLSFSTAPDSWEQNEFWVPLDEKSSGLHSYQQFTITAVILPLPWSQGCLGHFFYAALS